MDKVTRRIDVENFKIVKEGRHRDRLISYKEIVRTTPTGGRFIVANVVAIIGGVVMVGRMKPTDREVLLVARTQ